MNIQANIKQEDGSYENIFFKNNESNVYDSEGKSIEGKYVKKSGDTMTGNLVCPEFIAQNSNLNRVSSRLVNDFGDLIINNYLDENNYTMLVLCDESDFLGDMLHLWVVKNGVQNTYRVLHEGNVGELGFPKIAIGSYMGTGTYGQDNPTTITFPFPPKLVFVYAQNEGIMGQAGTDFLGVSSRCLIWWMPGITYQTLQGSYSTQLNFTSYNNVLSYYMITDASGWGAEWQFNFSGKTYNWIAIGG